MLPQFTKSTVAQMFDPVKSSPPLAAASNTDSVIHHKESLIHNKIIVSYGNMYGCKSYGVSSSKQLLSRSLFIKKFDYIRRCLKQVLGLTTAQREVTLRLLRLYAFYGLVYPKESQITEDPGCSKATFWRTIQLLKELGLVVVINRYVLRPHAQISNLYRLDKLVVLLARYLSEHIAHVWPDWLSPFLAMPLREFERWVFQTPEARAGPVIPAF